MRFAAIVAFLLAAAPALAQDPAPGPVGQPTGPMREQLHWVPYPAAPAPRQALLLMRVCRPPGDGPAKLAVINHGSPPVADRRPSMEPTRCDREATRWFLERGFVVAYPMRRGYGRTGGKWAESYGKCETPDFRAAGLTSANDVQAALAYAQALPFVRRDATVVVGQSAGGWATMALASRNPKNVAALVNFAGGRGAHRDNLPNNNCRPDALVEASARFGATARQPMLWVYAGNDTFIGPHIAGPMHAAFTGAGGIARFESVERYGSEGHNLFFGDGGSRIWGPMVERHLAERGVR
jgi:dienelactone hydrolase